MSCIELDLGTGHTGWICGVGARVVLKEERQEPIWCFGCRARQGGMHRLTGDAEPSYYEPNWSYRCDGCGDDRRLGFGRVWVWDE